MHCESHCESQHQVTPKNGLMTLADFVQFTLFMAPTSGKHEMRSGRRDGPISTGYHQQQPAHSNSDSDEDEQTQTCTKVVSIAPGEPDCSQRLNEERRNGCAEGIKVWWIEA